MRFLKIFVFLACLITTRPSLAISLNRSSDINFDTGLSSGKSWLISGGIPLSSPSRLVIPSGVEPNPSVIIPSGGQPNPSVIIPSGGDALNDTAIGAEYALFVVPLVLLLLLLGGSSDSTTSSIASTEELTSNPTSNLSSNPTSNLSSNPTSNLSSNPTPNLSSNPTPNLIRPEANKPTQCCTPPPPPIPEPSLLLGLIIFGGTLVLSGSRK